jgi:hypothetical protein
MPPKNPATPFDSPSDRFGLRYMPLYFSSIVLLLFFVYLLAVFLKGFDRVNPIVSAVAFALVFLLLFLLTAAMAVARTRFPALYYAFLALVIFVGLFLAANAASFIDLV